MWLVICLLFALTGAGQANVAPSFKWFPQGSEDGVHQLLIHFNDGGHDDIATLRQYVPIPTLAKELINPCIFRGHLIFEKEVMVTLTGCPNQNTFDIQFRSNRVQEYMFEVRDGLVQPLQSVFKNNEAYHDLVLETPKRLITPHKSSKVAPKSYKLRVSMNIDQTFKRRFGESSYERVQSIIAHAEAIFLWPSLDVPMYWNAFFEKEIPDDIEANVEGIILAREYNSGNGDTHVYLCNQGIDGIIGIAGGGGIICAPTLDRSDVAEYIESDMRTSEIVAHEVGHNLGMAHDFQDDGHLDRFDSQGNTCTNIGGVMDYAVATRWTTCSNEDFAVSDHSCLEPL